MSLPTQKDGASQPTGPAVETAFTATDGAGSHSAAVSKIRALFDAMGGRPLIVRFADDRAAILSAEALKFIPLSHEALNA